MSGRLVIGQAGHWRLIRLTMCVQFRGRVIVYGFAHMCGWSREQLGHLGHLGHLVIGQAGQQRLLGLTSRVSCP